MSESAPAGGQLLRQWRERRHLSQLELALTTGISTRHLSFMETGRSQPSREMIVHLAERLEVPLRERNVMLVACGYAPVFKESSLDDPVLRAARQAVDLVLAGLEPCPALAFDRHWTLLAANQATLRLFEGVDAALLQPPVNVLRVALHPGGLAPRIVNLTEWRSYIVARLRRQIEVSGDAVLAGLLEEFSAYPATGSSLAGRTAEVNRPYAGVVVRFRLAMDGAVLSFFSASTIFGTPIDVTLSELAIESFFPADEETLLILRRMAESNAENPGGAVRPAAVS